MPTPPAAPTPPLSPRKPPPPGAEDVAYLVDLSGYVFRAYHAVAPLSTQAGESTHAVMGTLSMLEKVLASRKAKLIGIAMDSKGPTFRHAMDPRYKANRPPAPPDLSSQMQRCEELVGLLGLRVLRTDGVEADDWIASATSRLLADGLRVVIISSDKDLMQLVRDDDDRVLLWDTMREKVYGADEVRAKWGVPPSQLRDLLALTGDTSDNVPGVRSVGPKTAAELLSRFGTLEAIYENLSLIARPKLRENLQACHEDALLSQRLVSLERHYLDNEPTFSLARAEPKTEKLVRLLTELELYRFLRGGTLMGALLPSQLPNTGAPRDGGGAGRAEVAIQDEPSASSAGALVPRSSPGAKAEEGESAPSNTSEEPAADARPRPERVCTATTALSLDTLSSFVAEARASGCFAFDTETTSLDPMQAELIGLGLAASATAALYVPIGHRYLGAPAQLPWPDVRAALESLFADPSIVKVAHHLKYDELVLRRHGLSVSDPVEDTMLQSYLLDPEEPHGLKALAQRKLSVMMRTYEEVTANRGAKKGSALAFDQVDVESATAYAGADAAMTLSLFTVQAKEVKERGLTPLLTDLELPLSRVLCAMEERGILVDLDKLGVVRARIDVEIERIEAEARALAPGVSLRSRLELERFLFDVLKLPVVKKTPKGARSTDADVLEELAPLHPFPALLLSYRELDKLRGTYVDALPRYVNPRTGRIHTSFGQAIAATGRISSNDPNLQNIPTRSELGKLIRGAFVAPPGMAIVSADYSQIELRVLAHLSADACLLEAFRSGEDVHAYTASQVFSVPLGEVTPDQRRQAKAVNFGVIYGMREAALGKQLGIPKEQALAFISAYFAKYSGVAAFLEETVLRAKADGYVTTLLGRRRYLPNLKSGRPPIRFEAERIAKNTPIQGTSADILKRAMIDVSRTPLPDGVHMLLTVHDELVFEVPVDCVESAGETIRRAMENAVTLSVPLVVDVGSGPSWADAH